MFSPRTPGTFDFIGDLKTSTGSGIGGAIITFTYTTFHDVHPRPLDRYTVGTGVFPPSTIGHFQIGPVILPSDCTDAPFGECFITAHYAGAAPSGGYDPSDKTTVVMFVPGTGPP
jgi:hypothetical protein